MSGDVQPRKRKDKKRKKDELGVEEPRGTAAALGEGDVFMHSQHEHGTGGHWCAKIIFFSLLAVLITLIGLIILENRGLTELEANSVESRYSGVLEGWLEDAPDDDHHDEHTLELLKQHDDDHDQEQEVSQEVTYDDQDDDDDHNDEETDEGHNDDDDDENDHNDDDDDETDNNDDDEENDHNDDDDEDNDQNNESDEERNQDDDDDDDDNYREDNSNEVDQDRLDDNSEEQHLDEDHEDDDDDNPNENDDSGERNDDEEDELQENENESVEDDDDDDLQNVGRDENDDEEHEEHEEEEGDSEIEVEKLEKEVVDDEVLSNEQPSHVDDDDDEDDKNDEVSSEHDEEDDHDPADEDEEFLEADDVDDPLPVVERIVTPKGKPLTEVDDEPTTGKPVDTLADEDEYEKQQEELRREQAQASHVWLKLVVGGALLVATHAVVSRATAPRDDTPASEDHSSRDVTPSLIDRRMTLIPEEPTATATSTQDIARSIEEVYETISPVSKGESPQNESGEEDEEVIVSAKDASATETAVDLETDDKELYSDDEEPEEVEDEELIAVKEAEIPQAVDKEVNPEFDEDDVPDDVEIIDDEQLEEELEEEEDEEEISDVDDAELLSRLEAKYGRLPEPERPGQKHKDGGDSIENDWPGEPSDKYWRQQLDEAEEELRQGDWSAASERVTAGPLKNSVRARWILARAIDVSAEVKRDNRLLTRAITAYLDVLKLNEHLSDTKLREITSRTLDRIRFRGNYLSAEPVYRLLIRRFPDVADYRNNLTVSYLMANRADLAEEVIKETLRKWPDDRIALAHHGFILKTQHNRNEEAVVAFQKALEGDIGAATEARFYYHLGDALLLLGRFEEAHEVHKRGAKLGHFLSPAQRSLYNVDRLKSQPWWDIEQTPYLKLARALEKSWKNILKEGLAAQALFEKEKEGLKEKGEWSQLDLFVRGQEVPGRCKTAPVTCSIVKSDPAAVGCRRGQIKFSSMEAGTHVRPHVGPTNCRLRMHLGLSNTKDTYLRVDRETRQWQVGKVFMFDDSFEHEVWHNGTGTRLVLIVDVWHPSLTSTERRSLPAI